MALTIAPEAVGDLDDIWRYIAVESSSEAIADRLVDSILNAIYLLSSHPLMGRAREDLRPELRGFPVGDYIVLYRQRAGDVLVLHVYHGRRNLEAMFQ